jgi:hypothetical protein
MKLAASRQCCGCRHAVFFQKGTLSHESEIEAHIRRIIDAGLSPTHFDAIEHPPASTVFHILTKLCRDTASKTSPFQRRLGQNLRFDRERILGRWLKKLHLWQVFQ